MIEVVYVPNRFEPAERVKRIVPYDRNLTLIDYIRKLDGAPRKISLSRHSIIISGEPVYDLNVKVKNHSQVIITNKVGIALAFFALDTLWGAIVSYAAYALAHPFVAAAYLAMAYSVYSAVTTKNRVPNSNASSGIDDGSSTYSWNGVSNSVGSGSPVPIIYGEHKTGGNVLNEYISQEGKESFYNVLLGLCEGEIEDISDIKINGNPVANYDGITSYKRYGTSNDAVIPHFEDLHNVYAVATNLTKNNAYYYTTQDTDVEAFELLFNLTSLFAQDGSGGIGSWSVSIQVRYKLHSAGTWTDLGVTTITEKSQSAVKYILRKDGLTAGQYDIEITRTSDDTDFTHFGDLKIQSIDEIQTDDLQYNYTAKLGIRALAVDQLSGSAPTITSIVKGKKVLLPNVKNGAVDVDWDDYYWDPDYNSGAGAFRLLSDDTVLTWDEETWVTAYSANPVWCLRDLLTSTRYGLGKYIDTTMVDDDDWLEMAQYCDEKVPDGDGGYEKRFRMDVVIDSLNSAVDLVNQLSAIFNGFAFWGRNFVNVVIDKPEDSVQIFGMGNIADGGFSLSWNSLRDVPNAVEVTFNDLAADYENETIEVADDTAIAAGDPERKTSMRLFCTRMSQALRSGRYALNVAKYVQRTVTLNLLIDAIACRPGNIISVSHDVTQWGFSGRVQTGATTTSIPLDRTVTIESGKSYVIRIRKDDDTIEEHDVVSSAGSYTTLTTDAFSFTPAKDDVYAFGESGVAAKDFRVLRIKRKGSTDEVELTAAEYNANVYDDSDVTLPENNYSALNFGIPPVLNLTLAEHLVMGNDGSFESAIDVYFQRPDDTDYYINRYKEAVIYYSDNAGASWEKAGKTSGEHFIIQGGIVVGTTYDIAIVSVSASGEEAAFSSAVTDDITILGKAAPPSNVSGFEVQQQGDRLRMSWTPVSDKDLARYEIRVGTDWDSALPIAQKVDVTEHDHPVGTVGEQTYLIKAIDTSGNASVTPGSDTIIVTPPPEMNFAVTLDLWKVRDKYILSDVVQEQRAIYDPDYTRAVFALASDQNWADLEGQSWDSIEAAGSMDEERPYKASGTMEQPADYAFDLGTIFEFNIVTDLDYLNVAGGSIAVQIWTSDDGTTWGAFATVSASTNYRARYIRFKYTLSTSDTNHNIYLYAGTIYVNAANVKVDYGRDVAIDAGGTYIKFRDDLTASPRPTSIIITSGTAIAYQIVSISAAGMTVKLIDISGSYVTGEISWEVKGS